MEWLSSNLGSIAVGAVLLCVVALVIRGMVRKKKLGKGSCSCGCENCSSACCCEFPKDIKIK